MPDLHPEQSAALSYIESRGTLESVEAVRARFRETLQDASELLESVPPESVRLQPPDGGWSVLEVVDHLVASHEPAVEELRELVAGREPRGGPIPAGLQSEAVSTVEWLRLLARFHEIHRDFLAVLKATSDSTPLAPKAPVLMVVKCETPDGLVPVHWVEPLDWKAYATALRLHVREHLEQIRRMESTWLAKPT